MPQGGDWSESILTNSLEDKIREGGGDNKMICSRALQCNPPIRN